MTAYFIRRLLLIPITLLGITLIVFLISRALPGGPIEAAMQAASQGDGSGRGSKDQASGSSVDTEQIERLEEEYGYHLPSPIAYLQWLGLWRKESDISKAEFKAVQRLQSNLIKDPQTQSLVVLARTGREALITRQSATSTEILSATYVDTGEDIRKDGWILRVETPDQRVEREARRLRKKTKFDPAQNRLVLDQADPTPSYAFRAIAYHGRFSGLLQGDLGRSSTYNDRVIDMILERIPIALYFGLITAFVTYSICIPLGIVKALKHRTFVDNFTSILIFVGYSVPGFALGAVLLVYFGARMQIFPLSGFVSSDFRDMTFWAQAKDLFLHSCLPLIAYLTGSFAITTMMMKNNLMDNLAADYVRTAVSKGVSFRSAVFRHAFRNSFIPIATSLGNLIAILVSGSMLVERVFDIPGFGLMQFQAIGARDQTVIMGTLVISSLLMLVGNLLSDFIVSLIDPRIKFN